MVLFFGAIISISFLEGSLKVIGYVSKQIFEQEAYANDPSDEKNIYKIMTVGNSYTAGLGAPPGHSYSDYLQKKLDQRGTRSYRVINTGKINANTTIILEQLPTLLKKHRPHVVFLRVGEPNMWNKYGYYDYLIQSDNNKNRVEQRKDISKRSELIKNILRYSSIYKAYDMIMDVNGEEVTVDSGYSHYFKSIPKNKEHRYHLAYTWLANLNKDSIIKMNELSEEQINEAEAFLKFLVQEDKNAFASLYLAKIYLRQKKQPTQALNFVSNAIDNQKTFDWNTWSFLVENQEVFKAVDFDLFESLYQKFLEKIDQAILRKVVLANNELHRSNLLRYSHKELYELSYYFRSQEDFLEAFYSSSEYKRRPEEAEKLLSMIERIVEVNPLAIRMDLLKLARQTAIDSPDLEPRYQSIKKLMKEKYYRYHPDHLNEKMNYVESWIINDLEKMISMIKANGAKVVIQTYPPVRHWSHRAVDRTLLNWWSHKEQGDLQFINAAEILREKFSIANGGGKYYTNGADSKDQHLSALGNQELAEIMLDLIP